MTDQTGAEQQSAAESRTGDVDVADQNRPDTTTDVQTGGATDLGSGGPDAGTAEDDAALRGGQDSDATRGERDTDDERDEAPREDARDSDEERQKTAEEFAREHDPEQHDVGAGEEFRQDGDWTADEAGGPQVWDNGGNLVEGSAPGRSDENSRPKDSSSDERRTSSLDEIRDGGYGVGSAATIADGAVPLGHPVKAWEDTKTFVTPDHPKYGEAEPHLWFADAYAAQRAGFRPVD